jgi:predicted unusual protein kinase regulating ubiquinone biosynthesis (AarF/ABC1/UbiB family)
MSALKTSPLQRNLALTRLGLGAGTHIMAHSIRNIFRGRMERDEANRAFFTQQAETLASELGRLKGSVMKVGQLLSLYGQYVLPEEAVQVLSQLQDDSPPLSWSVMAPLLERALGRRRLSELDVDPEPIGAASLGQVHRARRKSDGLEVVVKIQYPGVAEAIDSDIRTLSRLLMMTRLAPKGLNLGPMFSEVREMLLREVDYINERRYTEEFGTRLAGDTRFVVPRVIPDFSTDRVLTTTYEAGSHVQDPRVQSLPLERRNRFASAFIDVFLTEFFQWGLVQTDPHFGNYRLRVGATAEEDRVILLDFGATREFSREFIAGYREIVLGALFGDEKQVARGAYAIGLMPESVPDAVLDSFARTCALIVEPFAKPDDLPPELVNKNGDYRWGESDLPMRAANAFAHSALTVHFRLPPREIVFLHRRLTGTYVMLATLRAELNARPCLLRHLDVPEGG